MRNFEFSRGNNSGLRDLREKGQSKGLISLMMVGENRAMVGSACCEYVEIKRAELILSAHQDSTASWKGTENSRSESMGMSDSSSAWYKY